VLSFVNDVFAAIAPQPSSRRDAFRYDEHDRFPVAEGGSGPDDLAGNDRPPREVGRDGAPDHSLHALNVIAGESVQAAAARAADEIVRLLSGATVRDRATGIHRSAKPADIAILFRSRDSHRDFEAALDARGVATYVYKGLGFFDADEIQDAVALLRYLADPLSNLRAAALLRSRIVRLSDDAVERLSPHLAGAILAPDAPADLSSEDRIVFDRLREAVPRWLSWVDRMTPSELLSRVLAETAYAYEWRGARHLQARENLKKLRGMVRRIQNRGYATLARIADHLERLAVGDESNAAIDAVDAVSLMTVHAAKGLEFPIVFLVNMGRGTGGVRPPIRVSLVGDAEPSVAIADYQSEADEDAQAREREESKRLLYVALTRARDGLYLSSTVQDGKCRMGRGSLGEVLPEPVKALFVQALFESMVGAVEPRVSWTGPSGAAHVFSVPAVSVEPRVLEVRRESAIWKDDFAPIDEPSGT